MNESQEKVGNDDLLPTIKNKEQLINSNVSDTLKRIGKIVGYTTLAGTFLIGGAVATVPALGVPGVVAMAAFAGSIYTGYRGLENIVYKKEPSLMFEARRDFDGSMAIFQDSLAVPTYLRGMQDFEKGQVMALQTLIGFQRHKVNFGQSNMDYEIDENGRKVFNQEISTITHGINLKNMRMLEKLGYIKIDDEQSEFKQGLGQILGGKPKAKRGLLIAEKIGFGNIADLKKIAGFMLSGDKEGLESMKKDFHKISFRLTDKPIDFEDIYNRVNGYKSMDDLTQDEKTGLRRIGMIFNSSSRRMPGVLSITGNEADSKGKLRKLSIIDIKKDSYGRPYLDYNAKESFGNRLDRAHQVEIAVSRDNTFDENIKVSEPIRVPEQFREGSTVQKVQKNNSREEK